MHVPHIPFDYILMIFIYKINLCRRGAVVKGVKHISTIVLVNIWFWFCRSGFEFAETQLSILNH